MRYAHALLCCLLAFLSACGSDDEIKVLEKTIRAEVVKEVSAIATLEIAYIASIVYFQENMIQSDDMYIRKDRVRVDYGFEIDDDSIHVIDNGNGSRKVLKVRLCNGEVLSEDSVTLDIKTTHSGYIPKGVDVDSAILDDVRKTRSMYESSHIKLAEANIKNFFKIMAAKYDMDLDFKVEHE